MKKITTLIIFGTLLSAANAQSSKLPCSRPEYRQFDFWIGEWEAFGVNGKKAGDSKISLILDSCIILGLLLALGRDKKCHDRREDLKKRDAERDMARAMSRRA